MKSLISNSGYIGRFAPSPSGPLHFGSLVTAVGSYLQAKSQNGKWLLRIEDIDPPREVAGSSDSIMRCLEAHHLLWDDTVVYQSHRADLYNENIQRLTDQSFTYLCSCTRAQLAQLNQPTLCQCAHKNSGAPPNNSSGTNTGSESSDDSGQFAVRFKYNQPKGYFIDGLLGRIENSTSRAHGQFVIKRRDGLFAYQLAVVVDDIQQGITEIARGADLLDATFYQLALYSAFDYSAPTFLHFPVVVSEPGKKLSKQNHAKEVSANYRSKNLFDCLVFLGLDTPEELQHEPPENILKWAIQSWDVTKLMAQTERIDNRIGYQDRI
jgi:glutamyl-Q tRNA(Asp) synthetase